MQRAGNILRKFTKEFGLEGGIRVNAIRNQWVNIVGQTIAAHTCPDTIKGKILFLTVDTPQWMHHLSFYKEEISRKLQSYKVTEIRFKLGKLPERANGGGERENFILTDEDLRYIENTVKNIHLAGTEKAEMIGIFETMRPRIKYFPKANKTPSIANPIRV